MSKDQDQAGGVSVRRLPKISLHDHLDGAVRPKTIIEIAARTGVAVPATDPAELTEWIARQSDSGSLVEYLKTFDLSTAVMQDRAALVQVAREFVADLAADGVIYGEARWAPEQHLGGGMSLDEVVSAVSEGLQEGEDAAAAAGHDIRVNQILSAMRHTDSAREIAELAVAWRDLGVVGFDIAGPEDGFAPSRHRDAFTYLAGQFFPVTVHAGEAAGTESIRSALLDGRALRIGHGVRLAEDVHIVSRGDEEVSVRLGELAQWVRDREIPLELSPTSNLQTGASAQWGRELADHPFDLLYQLGFNVTVNVDNRTMSNTSLTQELTRLVEVFEYDLDDLEVFQLNAAAAAFLPVEQREELVELVSRGFETD